MRRSDKQTYSMLMWAKLSSGALAAKLAGMLALTGLAGLVWALAGPGDEPEDTRTRYDGFSAVAVDARTPAELERVLDLSADVWTERVGASPTVVVVSQDGLEALEATGIPHQIVVPDIQAAADQERDRLEQPQASKPSDWFAEFKNFQAVSDYMDTLAELRPDLVELHTLGRSVEGRPIRALRIAGSGDRQTTLMFNGGQHAREWISVMVPICIADRLIRGYDRDEGLRAVVDSTELFIVPVANPDGYQYSWDVDRYWRKNRGDTHGVDLNRNYSTAWGKAGSSGNKRSQIYRGKRAFSEPESAAMRDFFRDHEIDAHIDFHSFSQLILHPWSYQKASAPDRARLSAAADDMATSIHATHGKKYKTLAGAELYPASGTFMDWAYAEHQAVSFVIELRPAKGNGFVLPPEQIVPTCEESLAAVVALRTTMARDQAE